MDLGFGSLVDKFEEHFGKWPTRVMLAIIGLAALTVCIRLIVLDAILPIAEFLKGAGGQSLFDLALNVLFAAIVAGASALVVGLVFRWFVERKVNALIARAEENADRSRGVMDEANAAVAELRAYYDQMLAEEAELKSRQAEEG